MRYGSSLLPSLRRGAYASAVLLLVVCTALPAAAENAWIRVSQIGYEVGGTARAYLMSTAPESGATFRVLDAKGNVAYSAAVGPLLGTWGHSKALTYQVYALDFAVPRGKHYRVSVAGPLRATSPVFAVARPEDLYPGLLLDSLFFYQTERDGADYIPNALRSAPGHLKDEHADRFVTPPLDPDDNINNTPPTSPLIPATLPATDVSGGWWDAGDYLKYVATESYTTGLMQTGVRDFPAAMGASARQHPPAPLNAVSYAGRSGDGAPTNSDFSAEARFGVGWLLKMWDRQHKALSLQVDNSQEWNFYGAGDIASTACGGTFASAFCLITEYDIWTLPQAADNYQQAGDPEACDPHTTIYICNRPVFQAGAPGAKISPNLAGRMAASFALCYQLHHAAAPVLARQCLTAAEQIYALADLSFADPAASGGAGSLTTILPFDGYGETVWEDDMEWGATELALALAEATRCGDATSSSFALPVTKPDPYLRDATRFAAGYISNIASQGSADTLNLYDVSGLAHFELLRALRQMPDVRGLSVTEAKLRQQFLTQVEAAETTAAADPWGFGEPWNGGDVTSHGAGLSVMASEAFALTQAEHYNVDAQHWLGNILGANAWGSSFIVGEGSTFPNCIQHQVANIAGALDGTAGGTPVLWGASVEGPSPIPSSGLLDGMRVCPADGVDTFARFNGNPGVVDQDRFTRYKDDVQSYSTTEPAIDLTAASFLMWSWRLDPLSLP